MQRLRAEDLRAVVKFGHEAGELTEFGQLGSALGRLAGLVGADTATLTHLDLQTGHEVVVFWPSERAGKTRLEAYGQVGHTHPLRPLLVREIPRRAGQRLVPRISDVLSARQWRSHPVRSAMPDIADQMAVLLGGRPRVLHAVTLGRLSGPFGDRQRDSFTAAGPLLAAPLARASRDGHRALQIAPRPLWVPAAQAPALDRTDELDRSTARTELTPDLPLSPRELEVLRLVAEGATDAQVARRLGLQPATVSKHLSRIYARLGVPNRAAAVRYLGDHSI
jgi:DNA-binding CsgD family transcriptional regulator